MNPVPAGYLTPRARACARGLASCSAHLLTPNALASLNVQVCRRSNSAPSARALTSWTSRRGAVSALSSGLSLCMPSFDLHVHAFILRVRCFACVGLACANRSLRNVCLLTSFDLADCLNVRVMLVLAVSVSLNRRAGLVGL
jgi:hypothetical protein